VTNERHTNLYKGYTYSVLFRAAQQPSVPQNASNERGGDTLFRLQDGYNYKMPVHFGGNKFDPEFVVTQRTTDLTISYETDPAQLENYIPEEFELRAPEITVAFHKYTEINWLSGEYYSVISNSTGQVPGKEGSAGRRLLFGSLGEQSTHHRRARA